MAKQIIKINWKDSLTKLMGEIDGKTFYGDYADRHYVMLCRYYYSNSMGCIAVSKDMDYMHNLRSFILSIKKYYKEICNKETDEWFVENEYGIRFPVNWLLELSEETTFGLESVKLVELLNSKCLNFELKGFHKCKSDGYAAYITLNGYKICPMYVYYTGNQYEVWSDIGINVSETVCGKYVTAMGNRCGVYNAWSAMIAFIKDLAFGEMNARYANFDVNFGEGRSLAWHLFNNAGCYHAQFLTDKTLELLIKTGANQ